MKSPNNLFFGLGALLCLLLLPASGRAQAATKPRPDPAVVLRPYDPLERDPMKPKPYEVENEARDAQSGKEVEHALRDGNEACDAKPPRYADAERAYSEAAKLNPKEARAYLGLGRVYAAQNRVEETLAAYQKAIELKPKFAEARFNLGLVLSAIGKRDEALAQYEALQGLDKELARKLKDLMAK